MAQATEEQRHFEEDVIAAAVYVRERQGRRFGKAAAFKSLLTAVDRYNAALATAEPQVEEGGK